MSSADATHAIWQDPSTYDPDVHGPPYLRGKAAGTRREVVGRALRASARGRASAIYRLGSSAEGDELPTLLALLRALAVVHQTAHWQSRGEAFYADHLLFERLYGDLVGEIDSVAERAVGLLGSDSVDASRQMVKVSQFVDFFSSQPTSGPNMLALRSLRAETSFLLVTQVLVKGLKARGTFSRGTDNLVAGIEDKHEEHVYLLQQRVGVNPSSPKG